MHCLPFPQACSHVTSKLRCSLLYTNILLQHTSTWRGYWKQREPGSSGSIVSDYGLDDRAIGVRSPAGAKDFSCSFCVQTGSGAHPASCIMGTGGKARPGRDADHSPHLLPGSRMSRSYIPPLPPSASMACRGTALLLLLLLAVLTCEIITTQFPHSLNFYT
jgi:hypothetical protein